MFFLPLSARIGTVNVFSSSLRGALSTNAPRNFSADEAKWLRGAQRGDVRAFNQLVARHQERAYRVAYHLVQDPHAAANLTQSVITHALRALNELEQEAFEPWLLRQITQRCAAFLQLYPAATTPHTRVQRGMESLPFSERVTLVLADLENLPSQDIAQIMHTDIATVRARLHRARSALRDALLDAAA
jgi:RNA polymerase sigma-70 factor (ECF subfamily)